MKYLAHISLHSGQIRDRSPRSKVADAVIAQFGPVVNYRQLKQMADNQARLRTHLARLGWTYAELADWLTAPGTANHRACRSDKNIFTKPLALNTQRP